MKKTILAIGLMLFAASSTFAQDKATLTNVANENTGSFKFEEETFNFGNIKQGESVNHNFTFTNTGKEPIIISNAAGSCGCTVPIWPKEPIAPGAKAEIKVTFNSAGKMGQQDKTVTLTSNAKETSKVLHLTGMVDQPADAAPATLTPAAVPEKK